MSYSILWFDDEHQDYEIFKNRALKRKINITAVDNAKEGLEILKQKVENFDAILLDGLFFLQEGDNLDDVKNQAFGEVMKYLNNTRKENFMPCFLYSGQRSFVKEINEVVSIFESDLAGSKTIYDKLEPDDEDLLLSDIIEAIENIPEKKIKLAHPEIFKIFENGFLDYRCEEKFLEFFKDVQENKLVRNAFTPIRKILEQLVDQANELKLIPREIGTRNLTKAIDFLCGKDAEFRLKENYLHPIIEFILPNLLKIVQDGSHDKKDMDLKAEDFIKIRSQNYLIISCLHQLCEVLIEFNNMFLTYETKAENNWNKIQLSNIHEGEIEKDKDGNYHCGKYILGYKSIHGIYDIGQRIRITAVDKNNNSRNSDKYPEFAFKFETLD